jgi:glycine/D-amino acid oxidase-like deaminating enzyme
VVTSHENLWAQTAVAETLYPPLADSIRADVAVIGGGYCGLSAALHLAEADANVVVIEAHQAGWGASGRNGGQVIPGFKYDPDELEAMFGRDRGERIWRFGGGTADFVFDLIARHRMKVPTTRSGWVQGIHSEKAAVRGRRRAEQWQRRGADVEYLGAVATAEIVGTELYPGSVIDRGGGALQPLSYARELARAAATAGAAIYGETTVMRMTRTAEGYELLCQDGASVRAGNVLLCTNAYSGALVPGLADSIVAANSLQVATEPLSAELRARILPRGEVLSDTRKVIRYWRLDDQARLIMGGRGPYREPDGEADWAHLMKDVRVLFPMLAHLRFTHRWGGRVAIHTDYMPHLHEPSPGLLIAIGCQGRGIGLQSAMGAELARRALDRSYDPPLLFSTIDPIPFHALKAIGASLMVTWYRVMDRLGLS